MVTGNSIVSKALAEGSAHLHLVPAAVVTKGLTVTAGDGCPAIEYHDDDLHHD